jgi:hypothetical protein
MLNIHLVPKGLGALKGLLQGLDEPQIVFLSLALVLLIGFVLGVRWAGKRGYTTMKRDIASERAGLNGHRRDLDLRERQYEQDIRLLGRRHDMLDEFDRDLTEREAMACLHEADRDVGNQASPEPVLVSLDAVVA